jgi:uncharacterized protein (DUF362 family)
MMERRDFLKTSIATLASISAVRHSGTVSAQSTPPDLVVVQNGSPAALVRKAVAELGGMSQFVRKGDVVAVKPNMSWDRIPEQGATNNPEVVAEVVKLCLDAGAKTVKVFDFTLNEPVRCYRRTGIQKAAKDAGADVQFVYERRFKTVPIPDGVLVKQWPIYDDVLNADRIINIPCAKHHTVSGVSLGMKNFMGWIGGARGQIHRQYDIKIVDLNTILKADLTILDAYRQLFRNGPSGGNLTDVMLKKTVVAGKDPVALDSYGVRLFNLNPKQVPFLVEANKRGLGQLDLNRLNIKTVSLAENP